MLEILMATVQRLQDRFSYLVSVEQYNTFSNQEPGRS